MLQTAASGMMEEIIQGQERLLFTGDMMCRVLHAERVQQPVKRINCMTNNVEVQLLEKRQQ